MRFLGKIYEIKVSSSNFEHTIGLFAAVMYIDKQSFKQLSFTDCTFKGIPRSLGIYQLQSMKQADFVEPSMFKIMGSNSTSFTNCTISDYHYAEKAAFLEISQNSQVVIESCKFKDLSAGRAGAILMFVSGSLIIKNSAFERIAALDGGVFHLSERSEIQISGSRFAYNFALQNGVFKISGQSKFTIESSQFEWNQVIESNSIGQVFQVLDTGIFRNNKFINNRVGFGDGMTSLFSSQGIAIEIVSTSALILFQGCLFKDNAAPSGTPNIQLFKTTDVQIENSNFINSISINNYNALNYGGFLNVLSLSMVSIRKSSFKNGRAIQGGALYIQGNVYISISDTIFLSNFATLSGGAIYADSFSQLIISSNTKFQENIASKSGDSIFSTNSINGDLQISGSLFASSVSSNFIKAESIREANITESDFNVTKSALNKTEKSGGVHIKDVKQFLISGTSFSNLHGSYQSGGGALILEQTDRSLMSRGQIKECIFTNSSAETNGGGLAILNQYQLTVTNTTFIKNKANLSGGAIYYTCIGEGNCSVWLYNVIFTHNKAGFEGGAIKWTHFEPLMTNNKFNFNEAGTYGDDIASVARALVKIEEDQIGNKSLRIQHLLYKNNQSLRIDNVQSGGSMKLLFALVDRYGTFITSDNKSKLIIKTNITGNQNYVPVLESATEFTAESGFFRVNNLILISQPNSTQRLTFQTDGIDLNVPDNRELLLHQNNTGDDTAQLPEQAEAQINIDFGLRSCNLGEQLLQNGRCQICPSGQYLLELQTAPSICKKCQDLVSECPGGNEIYPLPGYWRISNQSDDFLKCLYPYACNGRQQLSNNAQGTCAEGYQGILCADCQKGYSKSHSSNRCSQCPTKVQNMLLVTVFILIFLIIIIILVRSNIQTGSSEKNFLPVFLRILLNHLQILSLTASFDFEWPEQLTSFYQTMQPASDVSTSLLSIDCLLQSDEFQNFSNQYRLYQVKGTFLALLPILLIASSTIVWLIIFKIKGRDNSVSTSQESPEVHSISNKKSSDELSEKEEGDLADSEKVFAPKSSMEVFENRSSQQFKSPQSPGSNATKMKSSAKLSVNQLNNIDHNQMQISPNQGQIISTIIVILFLIHPSITQEMFAIFNCKEIEGVSRLTQDLETACYQGQHKVVSFWVAIPSIIIYSVGIPLLGIITLFLNRHQLHREQVKQRYGFLYNGYKSGFAQYWEMIIIYRKVILIFIQMFLVQKGKITQALVTILLLISSLLLLKYVEPYSKSYLNKLEFSSLIISSISVYFGVFFISWKTAAAASQDNMQDLNNSGQILFMFSLIVTAHISFIIYWTYSFLVEFKATIRKRFPHAYVGLYLCFKKDSYLYEKEIDEYRKKIRPFVNKLSEIQKYFDNVLDLYQKGFIPNEDKELREKVLMLSEFLKRIEKERAFKGDIQTYKSVEEIIKNKRLNNFRGEVGTSIVFSDNANKGDRNYQQNSKGDEISINIRNSYFQGSAPSNLNESATSRRSSRQQKSQNLHLIKMQPDLVHELDLQGTEDYGTTGQCELDKTISRLLNPKDVNKKRVLKKRSGGLARLKNVVAKSGPLDLYVLKSEDYSKFELREEQPFKHCKKKIDEELCDVVPVRMTSERIAPQIIIEEEDISMVVSRQKQLDDQEKNDSESVSNNSSIAAPSRHYSGIQMNFSKMESNYDTKDEFEDKEAQAVTSAIRSTKRGISHFSKKSSNFNRLFSEELGTEYNHCGNNILQLKNNKEKSLREATSLAKQNVRDPIDLTVKVLPKFDRNHLNKSIKARNERMSNLNKSQIHLNRLRSLGQSDKNLLGIDAMNNNDDEEGVLDDDSMTN
ncbi:hypothetical protein FGO68_gene289 [Halteria grandinella]|uniref:DUF7630 domain-containing protein n=1 Tax=Halteria grandinella TaxID=5974 RepID=A0A8J8NGL8_HALGN|nr:hypothetical protein FGO68_gene289 [Halteria grandinella]